MPKDYKKDYKDLYLPKTKPMIIDIPEMKFVAVQGKGNPNDKGGEYPKALQILYSIQYTIKMSKMGSAKLDGYFDYVVPPLEGLWWNDGKEDKSFSDKSKFSWISMIRLPEFVDEKVFKWACDEVLSKKGIDTKKAQYFVYKEGLCVQCMHLGPYDDEPKTLSMMETFITENGLANDISDKRRHHEIYLADPTKTDASKLKTVLRIPVRKV